VKKRVWFGRRICIPVKKRFPTLQHLVESGILNDNEREIIQKIDEMYIQVKNAEPEFLNFEGAQEPIPRNKFRSLVGRYDNPISTRFLAPIECLKIPALD
jgi:hypothetical protein